MLHTAGDHMVSRVQETPYHQVQGFGSVTSEDDACRVTYAKQVGEGLSGLIDNAACFNGEAVSGAAGAGPGVAHETVHGLIDRFRFGPGGGRIIQIDHFVPYLTFFGMIIAYFCDGLSKKKTGGAEPPPV